MNKFLALAAASALALPATPALALDIGGNVATGFAPSQHMAPVTSVQGYHDEDRWDDDDDYRDRRYRDSRHGDYRRDYREDRRNYRENRRYYREGYRDGRRHEARYDRHGRYVEPRRVYRGDQVWRGRDGRYYCKRDNGTTGLIIGAAGGALVGREIDRYGDRTVGTLLGAALGGLLGREIDRGNARCR